MSKELYSRNNPKKRNDEDETDEIITSHLGYFTQQNVSTRYTITIDEPIQEAAYYRQVAHAIANSQKNDFIEYEISSPGGYVNGLVALLTAMEKTEATSVAWINGECHSAASMLALNCDVVYVSPYANMLVHFISFGSAGKAIDVRSKVQHVYATAEQLFRNTYKYFLTESEINDCLNGKELWLDSDEIQNRLKTKFDKLEEEANPKPKAKPRKKKEKQPKIEYPKIEVPEVE